MSDEFLEHCLHNHDVLGGAMGSKWNELKRDLFPSICKLCQVRPAAHLHHAVINKGKVRNKRLYKHLDVKENALEVCEICHQGADSYMIRRLSFEINCRRYGREHMKLWYKSLPLKVKELMP